MKLSFELLKLLVCPLTGKSLFYNKEAMLLINQEDGLAYPVSSRWDTTSSSC